MRVSISLEKTLTSRAAAVQIHQIARPFSSFVSTICTTVSYIYVILTQYKTQEQAPRIIKLKSEMKALMGIYAICVCIA